MAYTCLILHMKTLKVRLTHSNSVQLHWHREIQFSNLMFFLIFFSSSPCSSINKIIISLFSSFNNSLICTHFNYSVSFFYRSSRLTTHFIKNLSRLISYNIVAIFGLFFKKKKGKKNGKTVVKVFTLKYC